MQMRRPAAVFFRCAHFTDKRAGLQPVAGLQPTDGLMGKMPPECQERRATIGFMAQRDKATVSERILLDLDARDGGCKRRMDLGAGGLEEVEAEMARAAGLFDQAGDEHSPE